MTTRLALASFLAASTACAQPASAGLLAWYQFNDVGNVAKSSVADAKI